MIPLEPLPPESPNSPSGVESPQDESEPLDQFDHAVPGRDFQQTPMVGLGGSAGSIPALTQFFKDMPTDSGMSFVVILHLSPTHQSTMAEILGRVTIMPVMPAQDNQQALANHVYVIPAGKLLTIVNGHFRLLERQSERGKRNAVDLFFRSLADTYGPRAAAVVLSGVDGDGALGLKRIKECGGLTIAQDPKEAEFPGMPQSAINTGMVDWVLQVAEIPKRLIGYRDTEFRLRLPPEDGPSITSISKAAGDDGEAALRDCLLFLKTRTGRDFSCYKRATILRRMSRRMLVNGLEDLGSYSSFLRMHPAEANSLLQDLLISVTNFFRDADAFAALEQQIPELFKNKTSNDVVRVWVPACATGEEAYSIAILLLESAQTLEAPPVLQVFACDLDDEAIRVARAGHYPDTIAADVSEERLRRFFIKDHGGYHVRRELREMILFATHDLLKDAPFSRMDLISCRNLLIYLNHEAQSKVFETFHFALKPQGRLFLGSSESVDDGSPLFRIIDKKHRIYVHQATAQSGLPVPTGPSSLLRAIEAHEQAHDRVPVIHSKNFLTDVSVDFARKPSFKLDRATLANLHLKLIERFAAPSVIVNADYDIVHLSQNVGRFLQISGGEPTMNLLQVVHPSLRVELRAALFRAVESKLPVETTMVNSEIEGHQCTVTIRVSPAQDIDVGFLLVVFEKTSDSLVPPGAAADLSSLTSEPVMQHLERELEKVKGLLRDTIEQYEASTEELKASNEELQAMNEELRSATEELETSREELQSINEELTTVNQEMKSKVEELNHTNSDWQNLMAATSIATVFLDRDLSITRYTPAAAGIFNLIPGDIGRPLAHLRHRLDYPGLIEDGETVLQTLVPIEREVRDESHWFLARFQPYRTLEDHIAGAVLTLVDVTERNRAMEALRLSEERMRILIESAKDYAMFTTDRNRVIDSWNQGAQAMFGYTENEIVGKLADILFIAKDSANGDAEQEVQRALSEGRAANERWHARKDGTTFYGSGSVMPLRDSAGGLRGFVKIIRDRTTVKNTEESMLDQMHELSRFNAVAVGRETRMIELKQEVNTLCQKLGESPRYQFEFDAEDHRRAE